MAEVRGIKNEGTTYMKREDKLKDELKKIIGIAKRRWSEDKFNGWARTKDKFIELFLEKYIKQGGRGFLSLHAGCQNTLCIRQFLISYR